MKCAVVLSLLVCSALAAPSATGPLAFVHEAMAGSLPVQAIKAVLPNFEEEAEELVAHENTHELISLSEYPVWRLHHFNKLELRPVPLADLEKAPVAELVPAQVAAEYAPPQEVLPLHESPAEAFYGDDEQPDTSRLTFLGPILSVANGVKEVVGSVRNFVVGIPKSVLGFMGLGEDEEEVVEGLPIVPEIKVPVLTSKVVPKLPVKLPILAAEHRKPPTYVVVNKLVPQIVKNPVKLTKAPVKPIAVPKPIVSEVKNVEAEVPSKKEIILAKKPLLLKKPFVKPITIPKPIVVKKPLHTKNILVPASTIYVQEAPHSLLPSSYNNPDHVNSALNSPVRASGAGGVPTDVQNLPRLVQASVQALGNVNSIGQVADAIETYNELGNLISRSDANGFMPSAGFASKKVDIDTIRRTQQKPKEEGHVAKSVPQRASAPADFKSSPIDPIITLPATSAPEPSSTTTEQVVQDGKE